MNQFVIETEYPINFRGDEAKTLGLLLKNRHSVVLVGAKRVGISNFLRFFLYHKDIVPTYISKTQKHLFIAVDLNDLVERELFPFWMLTLKRIADTVENSILSEKTKKTVENELLNSIQSNDLFLVIDSIRSSVVEIMREGREVTIFFIRFDRIADASTEQFVNNLEGLKYATHNKLSFVFTTSKRLEELKPEVFKSSSLSLAANTLYIKPASREDTETIALTHLKKFNIKLDPSLEQNLLDLVNGYVQYMQLALISLGENPNQYASSSKEELINLLAKDERIALQSEELWDSLNPQEKEILIKTLQGKKISPADREAGKYLFDTGLLTENGEVFSPLFGQYIKTLSKKSQEDISPEFSKKELRLFEFLKENLDQICEREDIIEAVWPEEEALGVSDWAIDRLIARVRNKLRAQKSGYEIITIKTRGYKLVSS